MESLYLQFAEEAGRERVLGSCRSPCQEGNEANGIPGNLHPHYDNKFYGCVCCLYMP
jgi:hypothetical protein